MRLQTYIDELAARGRYHFATEEAASALGVSLNAARAALRRLKQRGEIADPYRGFHVIVPPEHRRLGCLPPEQFIPQLMDHLGEIYYVALLSAAEFHGAAHHRPQQFQVMLAANRRPIVCGDVQVQFVARRDLANTPVIEKNTPRGRVRIASPEATALELVGYAERCGGLDNVATVLADLADVLDPARLTAATANSPVVWSQRLGFLLDMLGHREIAEPLVAFVQHHASVVAPLLRKRAITNAPRDVRWKLAVNASVEADV